MIGQSCLLLSDYDEAIFWCKKSIEVKPDYYMAYDALANAYYF